MSVTSWLPALVALGIAVVSRRVGVALVMGTLTGHVLLHTVNKGALGVPWGLLGAARSALEQAVEPAHAQMLGLLCLVGAFVHTLDGSGAGGGLVAGLTGWARTPRRAELGAWVAGVVLFFSDMGSVLVVAPIARPLFDRAGVSRERLAWIVDTTASPICVLVPFIAWGVYVAGLVEAAAPGSEGTKVLVSALPVQLYPWLSLLFVPAMILAGRDVGPMAQARARPVADEPAHPDGVASPGPALFALAALALGIAGVGAAGVHWVGRLDGRVVRSALAAGYLLGWLALATSTRAPHLSLARRGVAAMAPVLGILLGAWCLADVSRQLGAAEALTAALGPWFPAGLLPVAVFLAGATMSLATGTSWGTFALLVPVAVALAEPLGVPLPLLLGAALSGGIFGDHASPVSDSTVLASMAAEVDHADHVATQAPYAAAVGVATAAGFISEGCLFSGTGLPMGAAVLALVVGATRYVGAPARRQRSAT